MSYAPILAAAFLLWPLMGVLGGQGYAPLLLVLSLIAIAIARPKWPPAPYAVAALVCVFWAGLSEIWSPASAAFISGNLLAGDFAIKSPVVRLFLLAVLGTIAVGGALRIPGGTAEKSSRLVLVGIALQYGSLIATLILAPIVLELRYGDDPVRQNEGIQNIIRNANAFVLVLPILFAFFWTREQLLHKFAAAFIMLSSLSLFLIIGAHSAFFGGLLMFAGFALVTFLPRSGFRVIFGLLAAYILTAPFAIEAGIVMLEHLGVGLPASFQSRAWSWEVVVGKIWEAPLFGHGVEASKTWNETFAAYPDWLARLPEFWAEYPVVPGHPHNMALQIWAELGLVGAALCALTLLLIGFWLPRPSAFFPHIRLAAAGMVLATVPVFSFAYSMTNDAFWSTAILAAMAIILLAKQAPNPA